MRVTTSRAAAADPNKIRIIGKIETSGGERTVWFEVPLDLEPAISDSGAMWALVMLPLAVQTGEVIDLELPLDPLFLENVRGLAATWLHWYPAQVRPVEINAPTRRVPSTAGRTAQFFSGGVDSWFTLLRYSESSDGFPQVGVVDDLITIHGFDVPIDNRDEFSKLKSLVGEAANDFGKRQLTIATNIRELKDTYWRSKWGPISHGAGLAACAMSLERRFSKVLIPSTHRLWELFPFGSHPVTDNLFSTSQTQFLHDHALYSRSDKLIRLAQSPKALASLKVCWNKGVFENCSVCGKCHRTLLCLDALGVLDQAKTFDVEKYLKNRYKIMFVPSANTAVRVTEVRDLALSRERQDLVRVAQSSLVRSRWAVPLSRAAYSVSYRLGNAVTKAHGMLT